MILGLHKLRLLTLGFIGLSPLATLWSKAYRGIESDGPLAPDPGEITPTIEVFPAQTGYVFSIVVGNRAASDMWEVSILRKDGNWTFVQSATGKSADITITPTDPGDPEQIQVRVQLKKANQPYGLLSDPAYVTVNP